MFFNVFVDMSLPTSSPLHTHSPIVRPATEGQRWGSATGGETEWRALLLFTWRISLLRNVQRCVCCATLFYAPNLFISSNVYTVLQM